MAFRSEQVPVICFQDMKVCICYVPDSQNPPDQMNDFRKIYHFPYGYSAGCQLMIDTFKDSVVLELYIQMQTVCGTEPLQERVNDTMQTMTLRVQRPCSVDVGLQSSAQTACAQYIQRAL